MANSSWNGSTNNSDTDLTAFCEGSQKVCISVDWVVNLAFTFNALAIPLNLAHMFILSRFKRVQNGVYFKVMILLTLSEILNPIKVMLKLSCSLRWVTMTSHTSARILIFYSDFVSYNRFVILTIAFIDRWMAMAKPFQYGESLFTRFFWVWVSISCGTTALLIIIRDVLISDTICMDEVYGVGNCGAELIPRITCQLYFTVNLLLDSVFMILILKELWKMRKRSLSADDKELKSASRTLLVLAGLYYFCLTVAPLASWNLSGLVKEDKVLKETIRLIFYIPLSLYSIMNVVVYGIMSEGYRARVKNMFKSVIPQRFNKVATSSSN